MIFFSFLKFYWRYYMSSLIQGAYDLHIHSAPDVLPRKADDLELAQRFLKAGMA